MIRTKIVRQINPSHSQVNGPLPLTAEGGTSGLNLFLCS